MYIYEQEKKQQQQMERRQKVPAQGQKPVKPKKQAALEEASMEQIRMTIEKDGTIKGIAEDKLKALIGVSKRQKLPKREEYNDEQLEAVKNYYLQHKSSEQIHKIQAQRLIENVLSSEPRPDTTSFRLQKEVLNKLIKTRYGPNPNQKQLADLATSFAIMGDDDKQLSLQEYKALYDAEQFVSSPEDLIIVHEAIKQIPNPKTENDIRQKYSEIYKQYTDPLLRQKAYMSETESEIEAEGYQSELEARRGGPKIPRISQSQYEILQSRVASHLRKMEKKNLVNEGENQDFTGQRSQVPIGIIEESKYEQIKGSGSEAESMREKQDKRKPIRKIKKIKPIGDDNVIADLKVAQKEVVRNGGQNGADLAVVENQEEVITNSVKYPTLDEMLNLSVTRQLEFDLAQREHLNKAQIQLMQEVLSTGAIYKPNIDFLRDQYKHEPTEANLEKYNQAIISQIGKQVAYYGGAPIEKDGQVVSTQEMAKVKPAKKGKFGAENIQDEVIVKQIAGQKSAFGKQAGKNMVAPALQIDLTKPEMLTIADITKGIAQIIDYISKLSGNLDTPDLRQYEKVTEIFKGSVVKKEPSQFKPQAGQGFKVRQLEC